MVKGIENIMCSAHTYYGQILYGQLLYHEYYGKIVASLIWIKLTHDVVKSVANKSICVIAASGFFFDLIIIIIM